MTFCVDIVLQDEIVLIAWLFENLEQIPALEIAVEPQWVFLALADGLIADDIWLAVSLHNDRRVKPSRSFQFKAGVDQLALVGFVVFEQWLFKFMITFSGFVATLELDFGRLISDVVSPKFGDELLVVKKAVGVDAILIWQQGVGLGQAFELFNGRVYDGTFDWGLRARIRKRLHLTNIYDNNNPIIWNPIAS